jgi:HK97 family phage major capsid protein
MNKMGVILRKYHGRFDAFLGGTRMPSTFASSAPTIGGTCGAMSALLLPLLVIVAVIAAFLAFASGPAHAHGHAMFGLAAAGSVELKDLQTELKTTFEKFKETHTALETEQKKQGEATAETNEQLKRLNARLDEVEIKHQRSRTMAGVARIDDEIREEQQRGERGPDRKAYAKWIRRGEKRLTDEEVKTLSSLKYFDRDEGEYKDLNTDADVEGGVFVPHQLANRIIQKLILVSPFRSVAAVENISSNALEIPKEGSQNFDAGWVGERGSRSKTQTATLGMERIPAHEMYAEPGVSQTQLDDSVFDIETWQTGRVATRMAQLEGAAFVKGNGVTQPEGFANNSQIPAANTLTIANGSFTGSAGADKLIDMWTQLPTYYANMASWVLNRASLGAVRKLKDNNNQYLWAPGGFGDGVRAGFSATIMGLGYTEMPDMDSIGSSKFPIALGAWQSAYQIVDRLGIRVIRDNLTAKPFVLFYTTKRVGGQVVLGEAIVQLKTT